MTQQESVAWAPVQEAITEYQDPAKADKITKIRRDLDETTEILVSACLPACLCVSLSLSLILPAVVCQSVILKSHPLFNALYRQHKTIDAVLERGVKLDELVERSNDLSSQSKLFYKQARKTNSCCTIS